MRLDLDHGLTTVLAILLPVIIIGAVGFAAVQTLEDPPAVTAPALAPPSTQADESLAPAGQTADVIGAGGYHDMETPVVVMDAPAPETTDDDATDDDATDDDATDGAAGDDARPSPLSIDIDAVDRITEQGALAVLLQLDVLGASTAGTVTVGDLDAVHRPGTTTLPFLVPVTDADIPVTATAPAGLRVRLVGWFGSLGGRPGGAFTPVAQTRIVDTRRDGAEPLPSGRAPFGLDDLGVDIPDNATHLVVNATALAVEGRGTLALAAGGQGGASSAPIAYVAGREESTLTVAPVDDEGFELVVDGSPAHVIVEIYGVLTPRQAGAPGAFSPAAPTVLLDTAGEAGPYRGQLTEGAVVELDLEGAGVANGAYAAVLSVTVDNQADDTGTPLVSVGRSVTDAANAGVIAGEVGTAATGLVIVALDEDGRAVVQSGIDGGSARVELLGWFA